ncbi:DUF932 domain-containing protein [Halomonas hibernica]|nr:DUF932 domain-containing protein [Halomonas hibernica]
MTAAKQVGFRRYVSLAFQKHRWQRSIISRSVVCNNTLAVALKGATATAVKVKHNTAFDPNL